MYPSRRLALYFSPLVLAAVLLGATSIARKSAAAQSSQQAAPPLSQRPDVTKPLEDKSVQGAPLQHEPSAAEMSKKETVASAFLRDLQFQEYEVRSAAEAMPEEKYSYRPRRREIQERKTRVRSGRSPHLRRTGEACGLFEFRLRRRIGRPEAARRLRQGRPQPGEIQEGIADLSARFVRRDPQIAGRHRRKEHVRSHRRALRGPEHAPRPGHRGDLAQRRPLRPADAPSAPERHRPARQPQESARAPRQLLRVGRVPSFVHNCTILIICTLCTKINTCTFSYKLIFLVRVPHAFHNVRSVDRGRHGIARPRGSPQPARKEACRHFKTPFAPEAHPAAVFRYRR